MNTDISTLGRDFLVWISSFSSFDLHMRHRANNESCNFISFWRFAFSESVICLLIVELFDRTSFIPFQLCVALVCTFVSAGIFSHVSLITKKSFVVLEFDICLLIF